MRMKTVLMLGAVIFALTSTSVQAQYYDKKEYEFAELRQNRQGNESILLHDDSTVFSDVDEDPQFPGGVDSINAWISNHFDYSKMGLCCAMGIVIVSFIVEPDGSITNIVKIREIGCNIADKVADTVRDMPKWIPGKLNGNVVRVRYVLPYTFCIE